MITLNLLPEIKREYLKARRTQGRVIGLAILVCIISAGLVVLAAMWVYGVQNLQKSNLTKSIHQKHTELSNIKDIGKYVTVQNQLGQISSLHQNKAMLSRTFAVFSKVNPKAPNNVRISTLSIDTETLTMTVDAETDTFTGLETFRDTLKNASLNYRVEGDETLQTEPLFSSVTIDSQGLSKAANGSSIVGFKLTLAYNDKMYARDSRDVSVSVPEKETTQSKQDAPDVFGESQAVPEEER